MSTDIPPTPEGHRPEWMQVKEWFDRLAELDDAERARALAAAPVSDAVRDEVRSLLAHVVDATGHGTFLSEPAAVHILKVEAATPDRFGAWQVVRLLGSGGAGDVFEVHRADGSFEGRAAIKRLKPGMSSEAVLQRFAQERQALARLHHPHIAQLYDAGLGPDGLPYFVMEYVDGQPLDIAARGLSVEARLGLFLQLADAVAYAHRNLLVHRDLKPGNVLVTHDGQVKLLDFGIAKALAATEPSARELTQGHATPFTPNYASPEQVRGEPVTTGTDIYSLGVLLYQLLTGVRPTGRNATTSAEAARSVLEEEPTRPSSLSPDLIADPEWMARRKRLEGDLDNILLMALEKPLERRYVSVDALAQDVRAYLGGELVKARARTWTYVVQKFYGRHRWGVSLGVAAVLALIGATGAALWQARVADQERLNAQRHLEDVRALARTMVFEVNDAMLEGLTSGRKVLLKASTDYLARRIATPDLSLEETLELVSALRRIADIEGNSRVGLVVKQGAALERYAQATALLERSAEPGRRQPKWWLAKASTLRSLALLQMGLGQPAASLASAVAGRDAAREAARLDPTHVGAQRAACGTRTAEADALYSAQGMPSLGRLRDAIGVLQESVVCAEAVLRAHPDDVGAGMVLSTVLTRLSQAQLMDGQLEAGVATAQRDLAHSEAVRAKAPQNHIAARLVTDAQWLVGYALLKVGRTADGLATMKTGVDAARALSAADPKAQVLRRFFVQAALPLAQAWTLHGQARQALALCEEGAELVRQDQAGDVSDPEQRLIEDGLAECQGNAWLALKRPDKALAAIEPHLQRHAARANGARDATDATDKQPRLVRGRALAQAMQARALHQLGRPGEALAAGALAVRDADTLVGLDPLNIETQGDVARVRLQVAALGPVAGRPAPLEACLLVRQADASFQALAQRKALDAAYADDARQARAQAERCPPAPN